MKRAIHALWAIPLCLFAVAAQAQEQIDPCRDLSSNPDWNAKLQDLQRFHEKGLFLDALDVAQDMARICSKSPILNYYMGIEYQGLNDEVKALNYLQRASDFTSDFVVPPSTAKQIWYARYEAEFPSHTQSNIDALNKEIESLNHKVQNLNEVSADYIQVAKNKQQANDAIIKNQLEASELRKEHLYKLMWTGIGIGIGGVAAAGAGTALLLIFKDQKSIYRQTGWALVGSGAALGVAGAIFGGIAGGWYSSLSSEDPEPLTFQAAPGYVGVSGVF